MSGKRLDQTLPMKQDHWPVLTLPEAARQRGWSLASAIRYNAVVIDGSATETWQVDVYGPASVTGQVIRPIALADIATRVAVVIRPQRVGTLEAPTVELLVEMVRQLGELAS